VAQALDIAQELAAEEISKIRRILLWPAGLRGATAPVNIEIRDRRKVLTKSPSARSYAMACVVGGR
jgi:hypothetical protein